MMRLLPLTLLAALVAAPLAALAVDVSPSKRTTPQNFIEPGGKRWKIFGSDPGRINKANDFDLKEFESEMKVKDNPVSLTPDPTDASGISSLTVTFYVKNTGKNPATLEFPDSQRYDFRVLDPAGQVCYVWSDDKVFVEAIGKSMVMAGDKLAFRVKIPLKEFSPAAAPGSYAVEAVLANYPQITARTQFQIVP